MRADENTQPDRAVGIAGVTPWHVTYVRPLADFRLEVKFADGNQGLVEMARFLAREPSLFNQVFVDDGVPAKVLRAAQAWIDANTRDVRREWATMNNPRRR